MEGNANSITSLYDSMKELESKMSEAKAKKDQIIARARTAKATTKVNDMLSGMGSGNSMAAFEKMASKVDQLEAEAEVSKQLAASSSTGKGTSLDAKFKVLAELLPPRPRITWHAKASFRDAPRPPARAPEDRPVDRGISHRRHTLPRLAGAGAWGRGRRACEDEAEPPAAEWSRRRAREDEGANGPINRRDAEAAGELTAVLCHHGSTGDPVVPFAGAETRQRHSLCSAWNGCVGARRLRPPPGQLHWPAQQHCNMCMAADSSREIDR